MYRIEKEGMVMQAGPLPRPAMNGDGEIKCPKCRETLWEGVKGHPEYYCFKCGKETMQIKNNIKSLPLDYILKRRLVKNIIKTNTFPL